MATIRVQPEPFDVGREIAHLSAGRTDIGGLGCFVGLVRGNADGDTLASLTLEHYPAMTESALAAIAATAETRWSLLGCTLIHRIGRLPPGEPIVLVLTAAAHRGPALDATAFLIDWLKTKAPFWKSEQSTDGTSRWVEARDSDDAAAARWVTG
jgi:molybdopterin synthase catalytic subunit